MSIPTSSSLPCSNCGSPVLVTPLLADALGAVPLRTGNITVLCDACSKAVPATPATRVFKVSVTFSELMGTEVVQGGEEDGLERNLWEDVGGFTLHGGAKTVRGFVNTQAKEWERRMEAILGMVDMPTPAPTPTAPTPAPIEPTPIEGDTPS